MATLTVIQIQANVQWQVFQSPEGNWIGVCDPLGITMQGSTLDELDINISESQQDLLRDLLRDNELESFLRTQGWKAKNLRDAKREDDVRFDLPYLLARSGRDTPRAVYQ